MQPTPIRRPAPSAPPYNVTPVDETGTLLREGGGFVLRRDRGGTFTLELRRTPVDLVEKRVHITGWETRSGHVDVEGIQKYRY